MFVIVSSLSWKIVIMRTYFSVQFSSVQFSLMCKRGRQNAIIQPTDSISFQLHDKSSPLNFTQYAVLPYNIKIVVWPQITVTSLHPMYSVCTKH